MGKEKREIERLQHEEAYGREGDSNEAMSSPVVLTKPGLKLSSVWVHKATEVAYVASIVSITSCDMPPWG